MSSIKLDGVAKSFGAIEVIPELSLTVNAGEFVVLVGPSGCGKSTLLRMIAGLEKCTEGTISIGDKVVNKLDASKRGIAMVFQTYALYPHMTVRQNIGFGLKMMRRTRAQIDARVDEVAQTLHLEKLMDRRPKDLSGGQRQRVAIGRSIVRDPDVFLFDEPLSNLDAELRVEMRLEIAALHQRLGATMVYVTHDQVEAMTLADKIAVMRDGRIEQFGAPRELFSDPANAFVAGFIGAPKMNFVSATILRREADHTILRTREGVELTAPALSAGVEGAGVLLGIRPQKVDIAAGGPHEMIAMHVEALGTGTNVFGAWQGVESFTIAVPSDLSLDEGHEIRFAIAPQDVFVFDPDSGDRIR